MFLSGKALSRRRLLAGAGAAVALPWLDAMCRQRVRSRVHEPCAWYA